NVEILVDGNPFVGLGHIVGRAAVDVCGHATGVPMLHVGGAEADARYRLATRGAPPRPPDGLQAAAARVAYARGVRSRTRPLAVPSAECVHTGCNLPSG